ncbi:MAG: hypothetical protein LBU32_00715 [Clostridiales bacterium]|nr:hypothetical protein [Clostridiales bacterium]
MSRKKLALALIAGLLALTLGAGGTMMFLQATSEETLTNTVTINQVLTAHINETGAVSYGDDEEKYGIEYDDVYNDVGADLVKVPQVSTEALDVVSYVRVQYTFSLADGSSFTEEDAQALFHAFIDNAVPGSDSTSETKWIFDPEDEEPDNDGEPITSFTGYIYYTNTAGNALAEVVGGATLPEVFGIWNIPSGLSEALHESDIQLILISQAAQVRGNEPEEEDVFANFFPAPDEDEE